VKYLLDTTVMSLLMRDAARRDRHVMAWLAGIDASEVCTSALVVREIWDGIENMRSRPDKAAELERRALARLAELEGRVVAVDGEIARMWAHLLKGRKKRDLDTGIAATARVRGLVVVTRNAKDFVDLGVRVIDPFRSPAVVHERE
jgi:toxin FitB